jgi:hypothetical protein
MLSPPEQQTDSPEFAIKRSRAAIQMDDRASEPFLQSVGPRLREKLVLIHGGSHCHTGGVNLEEVLR